MQCMQCNCRSITAEQPSAYKASIRTDILSQNRSDTNIGSTGLIQIPGTGNGQTLMMTRDTSARCTGMTLETRRAVLRAVIGDHVTSAKTAG